MGILKYELAHEITHIVMDYSENDYANLDSRKYSIGYGENVFELNEFDFEKVIKMLYMLNKSEQDARISATLKYIRERRVANNIDKMDYPTTVYYMDETKFLNQLDEFANQCDVVNQSPDSIVYILGYYMQFHHYLYGKLYKETVKKTIETQSFDKAICKMIKERYYHLYKEYRKKLFKYIINQEI